MDKVSGKWKVFLENSLPTLLEYNFQCPRSQVLVVSCSLWNGGYNILHFYKQNTSYSVKKLQTLKYNERKNYKFPQTSIVR